MFISELIGKPVVDIDGERVGSLNDLIARFQKDVSHPVIVGIVAKSQGEFRKISYSDIAIIVSPAITLNKSIKNLNPYAPNPQDFYLVEDVLDKQIIDVDDARVVRANDLQLLRVNGALVLSNVDIGTSAILRRIGLDAPIRKIASRLGHPVQPNFISLDDVELLPNSQSIRLRIPGNKLASLHPADLAEIISDLNRAESGQLLESLDVKKLADTLEEVEPDFQASLVNEMPDEKIADVLEEMSPDEAADLLAELPKERSADLLELMDKEEAKDVRKLLTYPIESAGGIMTTEFATIPPDLTAEQAINYLRENIEEAETVFYVYVVGENNVLLGVFSLSDLIMAQPNRKVADFMHKRVVNVKLLDDQEKVAQVIAKYNLLAVPVVDENEILHGIVTADDALDQIIPTAWKKRLPRMYH
jgi:magnesium transporter